MNRVRMMIGNGTAIVSRAIMILVMVGPVGCASDPWESRPAGASVQADAFLLFSDTSLPDVRDVPSIVMDAGTLDAGMIDAGMVDADTVDVGTIDSGLPSKDAGVKPDAVVRASLSADAGSPLPPIFPGAVVITEIMADPVQVADRSGEWLELYNPATDDAVNLRGCELLDQGRDLHVIERDLIIPPRGYVVLAASANGAELGFAPSYAYTGFTLANGDDEIILRCSMGVVDSVIYATETGFSWQPGASLSLDAAALDAEANDDGKRWCSSEVVYRAPSDNPDPEVLGDRGTPGAPNPPCPFD